MLPCAWAEWWWKAPALANTGRVSGYYLSPPPGRPPARTSVRMVEGKLSSGFADGGRTQGLTPNGCITELQGQQPASEESQELSRRISDLGPGSLLQYVYDDY
jgi:hypothetical protein